MPDRFATCKLHWDMAPSVSRKRVVDEYRAGEAARVDGSWPTRDYESAVQELVQQIERQLNKK